MTQMDWNSIATNQPLAFEAFCAHYGLTKKVPASWHTSHLESLVIEDLTGYLLTFFDEQGLYIVSDCRPFPNLIHFCEIKGIRPKYRTSAYLTRNDAMKEAIENAFRILEQNLVMLAQLEAILETQLQPLNAKE